MIKTFISPIKLSYFADMFGFGYSLRKNIAPREIQTLTIAGVIGQVERGGM